MSSQKEALGPLPPPPPAPGLWPREAVAVRHLCLGGPDVSPSLSAGPQLTWPGADDWVTWGTNTLLPSVTHRTHLHLLPSSNRKFRHKAGVTSGTQIADLGCVLSLLIRD